MIRSLRRLYRPCGLRLDRYASSSKAKIMDQPVSNAEECEEEFTAKEQMYSADKETHFGYQTVSEQEKAQKVKTVFENVADSYDVMNDAMSMGIHRIWKDKFIHRMKPGLTTRLIDVAGGTGDIAFRFLNHETKNYRKPSIPNFDYKPKIDRTIKTTNVEVNFKLGFEVQYQADEENAFSERSTRSVLVCDINSKMLEVGKKRAITALTPDQQGRIEWMEGDAENLQNIPDNSFDVYSISFGIRNCVHLDKVISEAYRILKPGGQFMCLEFSHVSNPLIKWVYDGYSFQVIPAMGQVVTGDWYSYKYLVESIRKFPTQEDFKAIIQEAGFKFVTYEDLTFGIASIHSGYKL